jgi:hypothetical protein
MDFKEIREGQKLFACSTNSLIQFPSIKKGDVPRKSLSVRGDGGEMVHALCSMNKKMCTNDVKINLPRCL